MAPIQNPTKIVIRKNIANILSNLTSSEKKIQSDQVTKKILALNAFKRANRISIYLSTADEVNTFDLLTEMFSSNKQVFVPSYRGNVMEMLKINGIADYENLPLTKWNIKQPNPNEGRENAIETGGLDLVLMPGVAFSKKLGGRVGHGMGYYDKYLERLFTTYPEKRSSTDSRGDIEAKSLNGKTILLALAFKEQIVEVDFPLAEHDILLDDIITAD